MSIFDRLLDLAEARVEKYGARYVAFGVFSGLSMFLPVYMWTVHTAGYTSVIVFRVLSIVFGFLMAIYSIWYPAFKKYVPLFWYFTVMFSLPFLNTYLTIIDGLSLFWVINITFALVLGMVLLDFLSFVIIFALGIFLAFLCATLLGRQIASSRMPQDIIQQSCYLIFFISVISFVFFKDKEREYINKMKAMKNLAGSIAHEIRTPLSTIIMYLNHLTEDNGKRVFETVLKNKRQAMLDEASYINSIIDMTLERLRDNRSEVICKVASVREYIDFAVNKYPFVGKERELVHIDIKSDFHIVANKNLLSQVLFNLIKNALYQIKIANKGEIFIIARSNKKGCTLSVKDTATGIKKADIERIFEPFRSGKVNGAGIGLHFCKDSVKAMNGGMRCESIYGEYANFIMEF